MHGVAVAVIVLCGCHSCYFCAVCGITVTVIMLYRCRGHSCYAIYSVAGAVVRLYGVVVIVIVVALMVVRA